MGEIRIIDTGRAIRAEIQGLVSGLDQRRGETVFRGDAAMVGTQGNEQRTSYASPYHAGGPEGNEKPVAHMPHPGKLHGKVAAGLLRRAKVLP